MGAGDHYNNTSRVLKLSICQVIFAFSAVVLTVPDAIARGGHGGGHHIGSGPHGGHGRHFGDGNHFGGGHRHFGGGSHLGGGNRRFGNHGHIGGSGHRHLGSSHRRAGSRHRHIGSRHRSHFGGRYYGSYPRSYSYSPSRYGYAYAPRTYPYSYPSYSSYRPRYYSSPPYVGNYNYPKKYTSRNNTYSYNSASASYPDTAASDYPTNGNNEVGWRLLANNNPSEALNVFAAQAGRHPKDGAPKVGYALSAAMQSDLNKAAWAMRRAFRIDPDSLHYLKIDATLRTSIDTLLADYQHQLDYAQGNRHFDVVFMIAALNYLIHENEAARVAIQESVDKLGDNSPSAINLQRLVVDNEY